MLEHAVHGTVSRLAHEEGWPITLPMQSDLERHILNYVQHNRSAMTELASIGSTIFKDYMLILAATNPYHPNYQQAWADIFKLIQASPSIAAWQRSFTDSALVNDPAPDMRVYYELHQHLAEFRFQCKLTTYINKIAMNAVNEWYRAQSALKRGGTGINSANKNTPPANRIKHLYLSEPISAYQRESIGDSLASADPEISNLAEDTLLMETIGQYIGQKMVNDRYFEVIIQVWKPLLFEIETPTQIAKRLNIPASEMFNLKNKMIRCVTPILRAWIEDAE